MRLAEINDRSVSVRGQEHLRFDSESFDVSAFSPYAGLLERLCAQPAESFNDCHLDGRPGAVLRSTVELATRRRIGAFFTGSRLRQTVFGGRWPLPTNTTFLDPACGAGDLLVASAATLPLHGDARETVSMWGSVLRGVDRVPQFVRAARARLYLYACQRTNTRPPCAPTELAALLPHITVGDGVALLKSQASQYTGCLLLNPPFGTSPAPSSYRLGTGSVSRAALFTVDALNSLAEGGRMVALLPDVLRGGSNYRTWRHWVSQQCAYLQIQTLCRFDAWTDVDVFGMQVVKAPTANAAGVWPGTDGAAGRPSIKDGFSVAVGAVVPHRDPEIGPLRRYIYARIVPLDGELSRYPEARRCLGPAFTPPFVVVRRTSTPESKVRLRATVVMGNQPVAVENHLIVLTPKDGSVDTCRLAAAYLRSAEAADWVNSRIRCRHVTTAVLKDLPWDAHANVFD